MSSKFQAGADQGAKRKLEEKLIRASERGDFETLDPSFWNELDAIAEGESGKKKRELEERLLAGLDSPDQGEVPKDCFKDLKAQVRKTKGRH